MGLYIVSVGYFVAGFPGAVAGWLAMITPALLMIPLIHFVGRKMDHPRVKAILQAVIIASAGLLLSAAIPLGKEGLTGPVTGWNSGGQLRVTADDQLDTLWIISGAAVVSLTTSAIGLASYL